SPAGGSDGIGHKRGHWGPSPARILAETGPTAHKMARTNAVFVCGACGGETLKWQGQCPLCGEWNTLEERRGAPRARAAASAAAVSLTEDAEGTAGSERLASGHGELDRVLGGGLVAGSVTLLGGDPGIGKSTLLLQVAAHLAGARAVIYASG